MPPLPEKLALEKEVARPEGCPLKEIPGLSQEVATDDLGLSHPLRGRNLLNLGKNKMSRGGWIRSGGV